MMCMASSEGNQNRQRHIVSQQTGWTAGHSKISGHFTYLDFSEIAGAFPKPQQPFWGKSGGRVVGREKN